MANTLSTSNLEQVNHESLRQRIDDKHVSVVNIPDSECDVSLEQVEHNTILLMEDGEHTEQVDHNSSIENDEEDTSLYDSDHEHSFFVQTADDQLNNTCISSGESEQFDIIEDDEDTLGNQISSQNDDITSEDEQSVSTQTEKYPDGRHVQTREELRLQQQISVLESENQRLRSEKHFIEQTLLGQLACSCASNAILYNSLRETANNLSARDIRNDDSKTCFYTGLSKYALFNALFDLLKGYYVSSSLPESVKMDYFFAVLVKLRLNPPLKWQT